MRLPGETLRRSIAITLAISFGAIACGEDKPSDAETLALRESEIERLSAELKIARTALLESQSEYAATFDSLPDNCKIAISAYIPTDGSELYVFTEDAEQITSPWCGPAHLNAVGDLRNMFHDLQFLQDTVNRTDFSLAANVASAMELKGIVDK
jgi:hypothetical protein